MSLWGRAFALLYDRVMAGTEREGLSARREDLLAGAHGSVVEIGAGTGVNLEHYPSTLTELVLVEPEAPMARRLERRVRESDLPARVVRAPAEAVPLPDASFDFAVATLVLCTVTDPAASLHELRRLLKPGGRLLFLEHVRAEDPRAARWQDRLHPLWLRFGHGCHCNRETLASIQAAGFAVDRLQKGELPKLPVIVRPLITGAATPAA